MAQRMGRVLNEFAVPSSARPGIVARLWHRQGKRRRAGSPTCRLDGLPSIPVDDGCRLTQRRLAFTLALVMKRAAMLRLAVEKP